MNQSTFLIGWVQIPNASKFIQIRGTFCNDIEQLAKCLMTVFVQSTPSSTYTAQIGNVETAYKEATPYLCTLAIADA